MKIAVAGENALVIRFGDTINPDTLAKVRQAVAIIEVELKDYIIDLIPSYASLVIVYRQEKIRLSSLRRLLRELLTNPQTALINSGKRVELPVYYSTSSGEDLERVADYQGVTTEEVIDLHSSVEYLVYAIGFAPGFAYLGEVDPALATPRHSTPRLRVPRGSVAIADRQTAVYPSVSPGGWNLIGRCPTPMFSHQSSPQMPVSVGDTVVFVPVSKKDFIRLGGTL
ncbi:MAG: 5-oxoprolinase subunit PxpB [Porticoccaceae bacterium]